MTKTKSYTMKFKGQHERQRKYLEKKRSIEAKHKRLGENNAIANAELYHDLEEIWRK